MSLKAKNIDNTKKEDNCTKNLKKRIERSVMIKEDKLKKGKWLKHEIDLLRRLFLTENTRQIADMFGRPLQTVRQKAYDLKLKRIQYHGPWSTDEIKQLKKLFLIRAI